MCCHWPRVALILLVPLALLVIGCAQETTPVPTVQASPTATRIPPPTTPLPTHPTTTPTAGHARLLGPGG